MQIANYRPSHRIALLLHGSFISLYVLLIVRAGMALYEGRLDPYRLLHNSLLTLIIKRMCGIVYGPFFAVLLSPSVEGNAYLIVTLVFALLSYALIHYGMFMNVSSGGSSTMAETILKLCRALFFFAGTLLLLLIVARMGLMLYQDIGVGRLQGGIGVPAKR